MKIVSANLNTSELFKQTVDLSFTGTTLSISLFTKKKF